MTTWTCPRASRVSNPFSAATNWITVKSVPVEPTVLENAPYSAEWSTSIFSAVERPRTPDTVSVASATIAA
jgi:hypothetical protein